jgi:membrane-associated HD superfamily phosphohydrolase
MLVTLFGIVTDVKLEQLSNADSPMLITLFGIVTDVKLEQLLNAD